jgi:hypothetical protein
MPMIEKIVMANSVVHKLFGKNENVWSRTSCFQSHWTTIFVRLDGGKLADYHWTIQHEIANLLTVASNTKAEKPAGTAVTQD